MTTRTIYAPHPPIPKHLAEVIAEMRRLGSPTIRVYDAGDHDVALEGSHRLAAAHTLGLPVIRDVLGGADEMDHDIEDVPTRRVADVVEYLGGPGSRQIDYLVEVE
jgi:hypothetical protein